MATAPAEELRPPRIAVYGLEKVGLTAVSGEHSTATHTLVFETYRTGSEFGEYDGVLLFQGIFERFERQSIPYWESWLEVDCDREMLDRREKEVTSLLAKGGFACIVLCEPFIDEDRHSSFKRTDLAKRLLNRERLHRFSLGGRYTEIRAVAGEFQRFLAAYGAACSTFTWQKDDLDVRPIAKWRTDTVGFSMGNRLFFVPALVPPNDAEKVLQYFHLLAEATLARRERARQEVPPWADTYVFPEEQALRAQLKDQTERIAMTEARLGQLGTFKLALVHDGDVLAEDVRSVLTRGLELRVSLEEDFREDLRIFDDQGGLAALVEVKGTSGGVKREFVNQAESHRERAGVVGQFPSVLIVNTGIKVASSLAAKDLDVAPEQAEHGRRLGVLVLRTLDLLGLVSLKQKGVVSSADVLRILTSSSGWLKVGADGYELFPPVA